MQLAQSQTYNNGALSTGATSNSSVAAPASNTWSEVQNETGTQQNQTPMRELQQPLQLQRFL
ncbi:hypothetical protein [Kaistella sp.]